MAGAFQVSSLSTNYNSGNDSVTSSGVNVANGGLSSGSEIGGGVLVSGTFSPMFSIETGLLYMPRGFTQTAISTGLLNGTATANYTYSYWQIPVVGRFHFSDVFSAGFGGYFAHAIGNIQYTQTSNISGVTLPAGTQYVGYESSGVSRTDYGLLLAVGAKIPVSDNSVSIYADARYAIGLKNINNGAVTTANPANPPDNNKWHDFQLLAGLCFSL